MNPSHHYQSPPPYTSKTHNDTSLSSDANSSHHSSPGGNRSRSFSINDILSENTGSRKRSISSDSNQEKIARVDMIVSPTTNSQHLLPLMQAGNVVMSPVNACLPLSPAGMCQSTAAPFQNQVAGYYHPLSMVTATTTPSFYPTFTPVTPQHISRANRQSIPNAALYPVLPNNVTSTGGCSQLQENMADMKIVSHLSDKSGHENIPGGDVSLTTIDNVLTVSQRCVMKKTITNQEDIEPHPSTTPIETTPDSTRRTYLPNYFQWSPLPGATNTFSPSIFLTRPGTAVHHLPINRTSPQSSPEEREGGVGGGQFMTSTPIRRNGEKLYLVSPSRVHSPISSHNNNNNEQQQRHNAGGGGDQMSLSPYEYSSGSDSEIPLLHRPRVPRRRPPRARTSLNPLLENTNNHHHPLPPPPLSLPSRVLPPPSAPPSAPPSTLLTSYKLQQGGGHYPNTSISDSGIVSDASNNNNSSNNASIAGMTTGAIYHRNFPLMEVSSGYQLQKTPVKGKFERGGYAKICGSSPVTDHLNKTGQIQSVPPWFVCSDKKSDGKRLRLTEAINRSLSDCGNQKHYQLPAEWQKLAYGQTEDQKTLTRKARNFLKGRPRVLKFDNTNTGPVSNKKN